MLLGFDMRTGIVHLAVRCPPTNTWPLPITTAVQVATLFDDDGIVVRFMNSMTEGNGIRDAASASALVQEVCSCGCHAARHPPMRVIQNTCSVI